MSKLTREGILAKREAMKKRKELEESQFKVDEKELVKDTNEVSLLKHQFTDEHPVHRKVAMLAQRMGMELQKVTDEGDHAYVHGPFVLLLNPNQKTLKINEVFSVGDSFNHCVHEVTDEYYEKIRKDMEYLLFIREGEELKKMIEKDREAWNSLYKKELGAW